MLFYDESIQFKKCRSNLVMHYRHHDTGNLNKLLNRCAMVVKPGTDFLIIKMASKVGPLPSCYCMKFLISNDFVGSLSAKLESLTVGCSSTRNRIYKHTVYRR